MKDEADGAVYRVVRFIGRGGMGEVYEAVREDTGVHYALKCLLLEHVRNPRTIERTRREALTLRDLRHPNVVQVRAIGVRQDGLIWMVMDLLDGHTLAQVKQRLGKLPLPWVLRMGQAVCAGLAAVHAHAVHRDIKPENLHLGTDAVVRVLDLGAGKFHRLGLLTTGAGVVGTVPYMSPEQLQASRSLDGRADLFSLGVVLAELLSGIHPFAPKGFANENVYTFVRRIVADPPVPLASYAPWVPPYIAEVIDRALARDRTERFGSATELGDALTGALDRLERAVGPGEPLGTLVAELAAPDRTSAADARWASAPTAEVWGASTEDADTLVMPR